MHAASPHEERGEAIQALLPALLRCRPSSNLVIGDSRSHTFADGACLRAICAPAARCHDRQPGAGIVAGG
jgi:hypothetical protein